jgi:tape measure domain-containing protein
MLEAFKLVGKISLSGGEKVKGMLKSIGDTVDESKQNFDGFGRSLRMIGGAVGVAGVALGGMGVAVAKVGIQYNAMAEQSEVAWTTLLGSSEKAQKQMKDIAEFAKATPFETEHVDAMAKYLHNAGLEGKGMFDELMKVSDVASAFAIPAHEAKEMTRQMAQVRNAGVAYTEDLNILEDKGVPIMKTIAKQLGITTAEAKKMASDGKISSEIYLNAFNEISSGVKGASEAQSQTFNGMISSLSDGAKMLAGLLTDKLFGKAKGFLERINTVVSDMVTVLQDGGGLKEVLSTFLPEDQAQKVVDFFNDVKAGLQWIKDNWQTIVSALTGITTAFIAFQVISTIAKTIQFFNAMMIAFRMGTVMATLAQWGFNTALLANPITWIAIAIGVLVGVIIYMWLNWDKVSKWLNDLWTKTKKVFSDTWGAIVNFFKTTVNNITKAVEILKMRVALHIAKLVFDAKRKFEEFKEKAGDAFEKAKDKIMNPIETAYNKIKDWIDKIKGFFTNLKLKIPKPSLPKMPKISLRTATKTIMGKTFTYPTGFRFNAKGGVFERMSLMGMSGGNLQFAGEAGREALVPLEGKHMLPMAKAITRYLAQSEIANSRRGNVEIPLYLDGREIARAIAPKVDQALGTLARRTARARGATL